MQRVSIPDTLPDCGEILPFFTEHISGWQLGMGLPDVLVGILRGLKAMGDTPNTVPVARGMGLWGFQAHPLATGMAQSFLDCGPVPAPRLLKLAARISAAPPLDGSDAEAMDTWYAAVRQDDISILLRLLALFFKTPKHLAWLEHCFEDLLHFGKPEISKAALDLLPQDETTQHVRRRLEAQWAFHCLPPGEALAMVEALDPEFWGLWRAYITAELLLRMDQGDEGIRILSDLWQAIPWHVNLTLKLYDLLSQIAPATSEDTGDTAILLYSWNKAELLAQTLDSLTGSDIGKARIFALDNGSTDHTSQVLADARDRFGADRFHVETLPVNVGAPAARNWLLALPGVQASRWAAFLDDDVILPPNWLLHLLGVAKDHPNAGAIGCRITAATPPHGLQSADYNLFPAPPEPVQPGILPNRVLIYNNCADTTDTGLFTYTRPCLSVSGCCHLINRESVAKAGGFDLRYTPSQFDDLDRDLRSALAGMPAVYTGSLAIRHVQHSSLAKSQTPRQIGHVMGNKFKLDTKYTDEQLIGLAQANRQHLAADLKAKYDFLVDHPRPGA